MAAKEIQEDMQMEETIEQQELWKIADRGILQIRTKLKNYKRLRENGICGEMFKNGEDKYKRTY